jgi:hypothetical protein
VSYFVTGKFEEDLNQHSESRGQVALEFAELLRSLWSHQYKSISPSDLKYTVGKFKVLTLDSLNFTFYGARIF